MNNEVKCVCGRVFEVTPPIPECVDDGVCVPFDLSNTGEHFDYSEADSVWRGAFGRTDSDVTCECGETIHVSVKIGVEKKQEPLGREAAEAVEQFFIESQLSYIENPGGRQIHASQHADGEWKEHTYLYQEGESFYFERFSHWDHTILFIQRDELKEHVAKLLPVLFTPEEMKKLLSGEGLPPGSTPQRPMS